MAECFGAVLRRLRLATTVMLVPDRPHLVGTRWGSGGRLSISALARLAGINASLVYRVEHGLTERPSRRVVQKLGRALGCSEGERALLLVSAGYWPWPDTDDARTEVLIGICLAVLDGDYRPYRQSTPEPIKTSDMMGAR